MSSRFGTCARIGCMLDVLNDVVVVIVLTGSAALFALLAWAGRTH